MTNSSLTHRRHAPLGFSRHTLQNVIAYNVAGIALDAWPLHVREEHEVSSRVFDFGQIPRLGDISSCESMSGHASVENRGMSSWSETSTESRDAPIRM